MFLRRALVPPLVALLAATVCVVAVVQAPSAGAEPDRGDLARVQARLERVRAVLADARSDAAAVARALHAAEQELKAGQARLEAARQRLALAKDRSMRAAAELDRAIERVERIQGEIDGRARAAYMTGAAPSVVGMSMLVTADSPADLLSKAKLVERVAAERNHALGELEQARDRADDIRQRLLAAELDAVQAAADVADQVRELAEVRAARARAKHALDQRVRSLRAHADELSAESGRITDLIRRREAAASARAAAIAAREAAGARGARRAGEWGGGVSGSGLSWPASCPLTSGFGYRWGRLHAGIDLGCPSGTAVRAAKGGVVLSAGWAGGYGNLVLIGHGNGVVTAYGHNSAVLVSPGQEVGRGQTIARSGNTGHSTGPHVHFEVRVGGSPRNPLGWLP
jgi:murein DD-endopeptidase MepM/ murein hydrolase activator NlpD